MSKRVRIGFEKQAIELPLTALLPIRQIKATDTSFGKYRAILASIRAVGLVEPMVVYPNRASRGTYLLLDGHMRLKALQEIGAEKALCLVSTEDDAFTYNDKISGLSLIQEHRMILKALDGGVMEDAIAKALDTDIALVRSRKTLLEGIHPEAVQFLKDKPITAQALSLLKKVKALRQIEMAQLMVSGNNYTHSYVRALLVGTPREHMVKPDEPKKVRGMSAEDVARMEREMETLERDYKLFEERYGENALHLGAAQRYVRRLLENTKVKRFLNQRHPEILEELQELAALESL
jgi:hypothetical protein